MQPTDADDRIWPPLETAQSALVALVTLTTAIAPLALPPMVVVLALVTLAQHLSRGWSLSAIPGTLMRSPAALATSAFLAYAAISCSWAAQPGFALKSLTQAALTGLAAWYVASTLSTQLTPLGPVRRARFVRALPLPGLAIGVYFLLDFLTGDGVTIFFAHNFPPIFDGAENTFYYDASHKLVGLDASYFNRAAAALALLTVSIVAAVQFWPRPNWGSALGMLTGMAMAGICLKSGSTTALLALMVSAFIFAMAHWSSKLATRFLQVAFLLVIAAAIPLSMLPKALNIDKNQALPLSFRERAIIWNDLANLTLEQPWAGTGVKSIKSQKRWAPRQDKIAEAGVGLRSYAHSHNGYLQVWLELGATGAALFAVAGFILLNTISSLPQAMQKYALSLAGSTAAIIGTAWSMWQPWFVAAIGFSWIALMMLRAEFENVDKHTQAH